MRRTPLKRSAPPRRTWLRCTHPPPLPKWVVEWWDSIRSQVCVVCKNQMEAGYAVTQGSRTEVAHVGLRGIGRKCDPREVLPLCAMHHRTGPYAHHRLGKHFWEFHGLDREALVVFYQEEYRKQGGVFL